jgi:hypothetical protein
MKAKILGIALATLVPLAATSGPARADTFLIEAEDTSTVSNPMLVKDAFAGSATPASAGRFVEVAAGQNNNGSSTTPALDPVTNQVPGQACYSMFFFETGVYRIYGRVIAANTSDDSFWVRIDNNAWINWNTIALGSSWHWDSVHLNNSTTPLTFNFNAQDVHTVCVAYREDGAKLDSLLVTSDATINPATATQPVQTSPSASRGGPLPELKVLAGSTTLFTQWTAVPGATTYTVKNSTAFDCEFNPAATFTAAKSNITNGFTFADTNSQRVAGSCYLVEATGGGVTVKSNVYASRVQSSFFDVSESDVFSVTSPLEFAGSVERVHPSTQQLEYLEVNGLVSQPSVPKQLDPAAITQGFARWDFQLAQQMDIQVWGLNTFFDPGTDSFWVRMDRGPWIKWNGWQVNSSTNSCSRNVFVDNEDTGRVGGGWIPLWDGDSPSAPRKIFTGLAAGSHSLELAFREPAAGMDRVVITSAINQMPGGCFD